MDRRFSKRRRKNELIALLLIAAFMERKKSEPMDPKADGFV